MILETSYPDLNTYNLFLIWKVFCERSDHNYLIRNLLLLGYRHHRSNYSCSPYPMHTDMWNILLNISEKTGIWQHLHWWKGHKFGAAMMENSTEVPQKIKSRTIIWSSNSNSVYLPKGNKIFISKRHLYSPVCCSIIHNSQGMETTEVSINRWLKKVDNPKWKPHSKVFFLPVLLRNNWYIITMHV